MKWRLSMAKDSYEVGYKKPPEKTKFQKGKSGNPSGRPKGIVNRSVKTFVPHDLRELFLKEGSKQIEVKENGEVIFMTKMQAFISQLFNKALRGENKTMSVLLKFMEEVAKQEKEDAASLVHDIVEEGVKDRTRIKDSIDGRKESILEIHLHLHKYYTHRRALRLAFGDDNIIPYEENEPVTSEDWHDFEERIIYYEKLDKSLKKREKQA